MKKTKGIFCVEGYWNNDLRDLSTVRPILELLDKREQIPHIHHDAACRDELLFLFKKWTQRRYSKYPILYISMHGNTSGLMPFAGNIVSLDDVGNVLEGKCKNRIILIGSCLIFKSRKKTLVNFVRKTGALMVCGYQCIVDWTQSTAFELLLMNELQRYNFDARSLRFMIQRAENLANRFPELQFKILTQ